MISRTGMHAINALAALAELPPGAYAGAGLVARRIGARQNYLGKLLQALTHEGLVRSQKGAGGGFRLARDPRAITLLEVLDPIEHVSQKGGCLLGRPCCSDAEPCAVHHRWTAAREAYLAILRETTIADLVDHHDLLEPLPGRLGAVAQGRRVFKNLKRPLIP